MTLGLSLNTSEIGGQKQQNRIIYANKQIRIERLTEIQELIKQWIAQRGERIEEYKQSINVIAGPFIILSKGNRQILQSIDGSAVVLNLNPHNDQLPGFFVAKTIIYEFNNKYEAIAVLNNGLIHYYHNLKLLKNGIEVQTPVDSCRIDFFSGERITCIKYYQYALYIATTHGRIVKIAQIGGQLAMQYQNFTNLQNNGKSHRDVIGIHGTTKRDNGKSGVAKVAKKRKQLVQSHFQDAKISEFQMQLNNQISKKLNDELFGEESKILGMKASQKYIYCLQEGQIIQFDANSLKRLFTLNIKQKLEDLNFTVVNKGNYKECANPDKVIIRDFDIQDKFYYVLCDYLPHAQSNKYFGVFILKIDISTQSMQFFNIQARGMQQSARDIDSQFIIDENYYNKEPETVKKHQKDEKMSFKTAVDILHRFINPDFFPISQLLTRQRIYMGRFGTGVLNILVSSQLFKASLSIIHDSRKLKTHFDVEGDSIERYVDWSINCNGIEVCERLNRLPQFFLQLYSDVCPSAMSSGKAQILTQLRCKPKKVGLKARIGAMVFGCQRVGFYELNCQQLPLSGRRSDKGTLLLSEKYRNHLRRTHLHMYRIINCDLCDPVLAKNSRKFRSGSLFLNIENEGLYLVQQFCQHWFFEGNNENQREQTLLQNFTNYLRNEEVGYVKQVSRNDADAVKNVFHEISVIAMNITCRPLIDVQHDKRWFQEWGKVNKEQKENYLTHEELSVLKTANEQKLEELGYFVHFIKEINYYDLDERISQICLGYFDALNGVSYVLGRLLESELSGRPELCVIVQERLCSVCDTEAAKSLNLHPVEEVLSNVGRHLECKLFQRVLLGDEYVTSGGQNLAGNVPANLAGLLGEAFAGYCDEVVERRIAESYVFDFVWRREVWQSVFDLHGVEEFVRRNEPGRGALGLSSWCRLHGVLFFFGYEAFKARGGALGDTLLRSPGFEPAGARVLTRFRFYSEALAYSARLPQLSRGDTIVALQNGRLPFLYSPELHDSTQTLTDRLAFYYQQFEQLARLSTPPVTPPSLSEIENLKFLVLMKKQLTQSSNQRIQGQNVDFGIDFGCSENSTCATEMHEGKVSGFLIPILNEQLLQLFKQAQVEEEVFASLDVRPDEFGRLLRESPEYEGLTWFWDVNINNE